MLGTYLYNYIMIIIEQVDTKKKNINIIDNYGQPI